MKREPILFIRGSKKRAEEIKHILVDKWGGYNYWNLLFNDEKLLYFIDQLGRVNTELDRELLKKAIEKGWMKEYVLPKQQKFKSFDKVVVKLKHSLTAWYADIYSHEDEESFYFIGNFANNKNHTIVFPSMRKLRNLSVQTMSGKRAMNER